MEQGRFALALRLLERRFGVLPPEVLVRLESVDPDVVVERIFEARDPLDALGLKQAHHDS